MPAICISHHYSRLIRVFGWTLRFFIFTFSTRRQGVRVIFNNINFRIAESRLTRCGTRIQANAALLNSFTIIAGGNDWRCFIGAKILLWQPTMSQRSQQSTFCGRCMTSALLLYIVVTVRGIGECALIAQHLALVVRVIGAQFLAHCARYYFAALCIMQMSIGSHTFHAITVAALVDIR